MVDMTVDAGCWGFSVLNPLAAWFQAIIDCKIVSPFMYKDRYLMSPSDLYLAAEGVCLVIELTSPEKYLTLVNTAGLALVRMVCWTTLGTVINVLEIDLATRGAETRTSWRANIVRKERKKN